MTQARARAHGVVTPSLSQLSLTATLRVLVRLVLGLASTLQMILNRRPRDWHTRATHEALPRETSGIFQERIQPTQPSFSGKAAGRIPGIPVVSTQGTATYSLCAPNQDARNKPEHDPVVVAQPGNGPLARVPGEGGDPDSARSAACNKAQFSPRSSRRTSGSRAKAKPCPSLQLQSCTRAKPFLDSDPHPELVEGRRNERLLSRTAASISLI